MIVSLSFQLSWGCFISLPILTSFVHGIQVVLHPEAHTFSVRTVSPGTGQRGLLIISYYLKTTLSCLWGKNLYNRHGKSNMFQCYTFSCRNYPVQVVKVHTSLAFPHGRRLIHKCSTHLSVGPIQNSTHRCKGSVSLQVLCL